VVKRQIYDHAYVEMLRYKDCTNYGGLKILVFKGRYKIKERIDPHFLEDQPDLLARFRPTEDGWMLAMAFATYIEGGET